ncbi:MAG: glycosyltransferase [Candidatus Acidiferrales bacterium]
MRVKEGEFIFLWPGGIRGVKDPLFLLRAFSRSRGDYPRARVLFVGPILEPGYGRRFLRALPGVRGAYWQRAVPARAMAGIYAASDVVVNSSLSEGMSNALLEAMAMGVPVLARAIEGNRALVRHNRTGLLFASERDFLRQAQHLLTDAGLRRRLAAAALAQVRRRHNAASEVRAHLQLYRQLLGEKRRG